jgi:hypothetical protein
LPSMILASVYLNAEGGSYLTFGIPIGIFCVVGVILWVLLFTRPHRRVPARRIVAPAHAGPPAGAAARAAAVAGGLPTAAGGGSTESSAEPTGAHLEASSAEPGSMPSRGRHAAEADETERNEGTE